MLQPLKSEINNLREMLMDAVRRSNNPVIAIGNGLEFDGQGFKFNNQFVKFRGQMTPANFQQISGQAPNSAIFQHLEQLYTEIATFTGIDLRNIMGQSQQTAYQTAVQKEAQLQRMNNVIFNRDEAYTRADRLDLQNIMLYYPRKLAYEAYEVDKNSQPVKEPRKSFPSIELDGESVKNKKFVKKEGKEFLQITPEMIR